MRLERTRSLPIPSQKVKCERVERDTARQTETETERVRETEIERENRQKQQRESMNGQKQQFLLCELDFQVGGEVIYGCGDPNIIFTCVDAGKGAQA